MRVKPRIVHRGGQWIAGLLLAACLVGSQVAAAGESSPLTWQWQPYNQGLVPHAMVMTVAVQSDHPATLYAGTYEPPGLWRSDDGGDSWVVDDQGLRGSPVYAAHWNDMRSRWWIGARDGLYTRTSVAAAWQPAGLEGVRGVYALAQDKSGRLYAATEDGLFRTDDMKSWQAVPVVRVGAEPAILALAVSPDGRTLLAGTRGQGAWLSSNGGAGWSPATGPGAETFVTALMFAPEPAAVAHAGTGAGIYRSTNGGKTWQAVNGLQSQAYEFAAGTDGSLFAALAGQVARSTDGGLSWTLHGAGLRPGERLLDLTPDPDNPALLFAAAWDGLYVSQDRGESWSKPDEGPGYPDVNTLAWDSTGNLLAGTRLGLYRRTPDAGAWETAAGIQGRPVLTIAQAGEGQDLYAGCSGGLFRSTDGGETWAEVISELSDDGIAGVVIDPADPNHLQAWVAFGRVHESRDGGVNWIPRWEGLGDVRPVTAIHRSVTGEIYAGAEDGLFRWQAAGEVWQSLSLPLVAPTVFVIETDARDTGAVHAGATDGLWRSQDDGSTWRRWGKGLEGITVTAISVSPTDRQSAFAGTRHAGLYMTANGGATWEPAWKDRLASASVRDILFNAEGTTVYVASDRGIWQGKVRDAR